MLIGRLGPYKAYHNNIPKANLPHVRMMLAKVFKCPPRPAYSDLGVRDFVYHPIHSSLKLGFGLVYSFALGSPSREIDNTLNISQTVLITKWDDAVAFLAYPEPKIISQGQDSRAHVSLLVQAIYADKAATKEFIEEHKRPLSEELIYCAIRQFRSEKKLGPVTLELHWYELSEDGERLTERIGNDLSLANVSTPNSILIPDIPEPVLPLTVPSS